MSKPEHSPKASRRAVLGGSIAALGWSAFDRAEAAVQEKAAAAAPVNPRQPIRITRLETLMVQPRWLFLKVHTDAGIVGLGEPIVEGRAETVATAIKEIEPYLIGKDPRRVVHHWQAIYRHAFYRGGPILTSALSGIDMALWDIKGKALGVPVYELLGGPTRDRVRVYAHAGTPEQIKTGPPARLHGLQDQPRQASAARGTSRLRPRSTTRPRGSPSCARPSATMSTSPSTSTAPSARRPPSC